MRSAVWISFDLGVKGDYEGMYRWLDEHEARECGDSVAFLRVKVPKANIVKFFTDELRKAVALDNRSRIYIIFKKADGKVSGKWIIGGRRPPPWAGYAPTEPTPEDVDAI